MFNKNIKNKDSENNQYIFQKCLRNVTILIYLLMLRNVFFLFNILKCISNLNKKNKNQIVFSSKMKIDIYRVIYMVSIILLVYKINLLSFNIIFLFFQLRSFKTSIRNLRKNIVEDSSKNVSENTFKKTSNITMLLFSIIILYIKTNNIFVKFQFQPKGIYRWKGKK